MAVHHGMAHKLAETIMHSEPGKAAIAGSAGLLVAAAPIVSPAVAVFAVSVGAVLGITWGICKIGEMLD